MSTRHFFGLLPSPRYLVARQFILSFLPFGACVLGFISAFLRARWRGSSYLRLLFPNSSASMLSSMCWPVQDGRVRADLRRHDGQQLSGCSTGRTSGRFVRRAYTCRAGSIGMFSALALASPSSLAVVPLAWMPPHLAMLRFTWLLDLHFMTLRPLSSHVVVVVVSKLLASRGLVELLSPPPLRHTLSLSISHIYTLTLFIPPSSSSLLPSWSLHPSPAVARLVRAPILASRRRLRPHRLPACPCPRPK